MSKQRGNSRHLHDNSPPHRKLTHIGVAFNSLSRELSSAVQLHHNIGSARWRHPALSPCLRPYSAFDVAWAVTDGRSPLDYGRTTAFITLRLISNWTGVWITQTLLGPHADGNVYKQSNLGTYRVILRRIRKGVCVGITGDGPLGPIGVVKSAPLQWGRRTNMPIFAYAFSTKRHKRQDRWDHMTLPLPFTQDGRVFPQLDLALEWEDHSGRK